MGILNLKINLEMCVTVGARTQVGKNTTRVKVPAKRGLTNRTASWYNDPAVGDSSSPTGIHKL